MIENLFNNLFGNFLEPILSNLLLVVIALFGLSYMVKGRPRNKTVRIEKENGENIYIRKNNFTKNLLVIIILILVIEVLIKGR